MSIDSTILLGVPAIHNFIEEKRLDSNRLINDKNYASKVLENYFTDSSGELRKVANGQDIPYVFLLFCIGDIQEAKSQLAELKKRKFSRSVEHTMQLISGFIHFFYGEYATALTDLEESLRLLNNKKGEWYHLIKLAIAETYCYLKRFKEAEQECLKVINSTKENKPFRSSFLSYAEYILSIVFYRTTEKLPSNQQELQYKKAKVYVGNVIMFLRNNYDRQASEIARVQLCEAYHLLSMIDYSLGNDEIALDSIKEIQKLDRNYSQANLMEFIIRYKISKLDENGLKSKNMLIKHFSKNKNEIRKVWEELPNELYVTHEPESTTLQIEITSDDRLCAKFCRQVLKDGFNKPKYEDLSKYYWSRPEMTVIGPDNKPSKSSYEIGKNRNDYRSLMLSNKNEKKIVIVHHLFDSPRWFLENPDSYVEKIQKLVKELFEQYRTFMQSDEFKEYKFIHTGVGLGAAVAEVFAWVFQQKFVSFDSTGANEVIRKLSDINNKEDLVFANGCSYYSKVNWYNTRFQPGNHRLLKVTANSFNDEKLIDLAYESRIPYASMLPMLRTIEKGGSASVINTWPQQVDPNLFLLDISSQRISYHNKETLKLLTETESDFEKIQKFFVKHSYIATDSKKNETLTLYHIDFTYSEHNCAHVWFAYLVQLIRTHHSTPLVLDQCRLTLEQLNILINSGIEQLKFKHCDIHGSELRKIGITENCKLKSLIFIDDNITQEGTRHLNQIVKEDNIKLYVTAIKSIRLIPELTHINTDTNDKPTQVQNFIIQIINAGQGAVVHANAFKNIQTEIDIAPTFLSKSASADQQRSADLQPTTGENVMPKTAILSAEIIQKQKSVFERTLVSELIAELDNVRAIAGDRADARQTYKEKLVQVFEKALSIGLDAVAKGTGELASKALAATVTATTSAISTGSGFAAQGAAAFWKREATIKNQRLADLLFSDDDQLLESSLRQFARLASLRYEHLIATRLSDDPSVSVIPLARIGARRVIDFLQRLVSDCQTTKTPEEILKHWKQEWKPESGDHVPFTDILLDSLIQGHSGKYVDNLFRNNRLIGREDFVKETMTVEGALGRSAMRVQFEGDKPMTPSWPIYFRNESLHKLQGIDEKYSWGKTNSQDNGTGPKYGYLLVDSMTAFNYGFDQEHYPSAVSQRDENNYLPVVYQATQQDVIAYLNREPAMKLLSFSKFIQEYKCNREINEIWLHYFDFTALTEFKNGSDKIVIADADFSSIDMTGCTFEGTTLKNVNLYKANLSFAKANACVFEDVKMAQTDWTGADLRYTKFTRVESTAMATWLGCQLEGLTETTDAKLIKKIHSLQQDQLKANEQFREDNKNLRIELKNVEKRLCDKQKALQHQLDILKDATAEQKQELISQHEQTAQLQLNLKVFSEDCQLLRHQFESAIAKLTRDQVNLREEYKQSVEQLDAQIQKLDKQSKTCEQSLAKIDADVKALTERVGKLEGRVDGLEKVIQEAQIANSKVTADVADVVVNLQQNYTAAPNSIMLVKGSKAIHTRIQVPGTYTDKNQETVHHALDLNANKKAIVGGTKTLNTQTGAIMLVDADEAVVNDIILGDNKEANRAAAFEETITQAALDALKQRNLQSHSGVTTTTATTTVSALPTISPNRVE